MSNECIGIVAIFDRKSQSKISVYGEHLRSVVFSLELKHLRRSIPGMPKTDYAARTSFVILTLIFLSALSMSIADLIQANYKEGVFMLIVGLVGLWSIGFHKVLCKFVIKVVYSILGILRPKRS